MIETATSAGTKPNGHGEVRPPTANRPARAERPEADAASTKHARYFLMKSGQAEKAPELGQEFTSEGEAMVEAFRVAGTFVVLEEYRTTTDLTGKNPQLKKEAVSRK